MRILIVEDDESIREVFKLILEMEKPFDELTVDTAGNGSEATERVQSIKPDVVLLDLTLPGEHGFEVFKRIRALEGCEQIPIVAVSAHNGGALMQEALDLGFSAYVTKPIDFERALFPTLKRLFGKIQNQGHEAA